VSGNDLDLLARVRKLRDHGRISKYEHDEIGYGERLDALQAAVLGVKLGYLADWVDARRRHARTYSRLLEGAPVTTPSEDPADDHAFHLYVLRSAHRDELLKRLVEAGIGAGIHYPIPLHRQPAYRDLPPVSLPHTDAAAAEVLSLPLYPELAADDLETVADAVRRFAA
jgi:dTDP-4-amino-4,6-dideoxygalactose transaminase